MLDAVGSQFDESIELSSFAVSPSGRPSAREPSIVEPIDVAVDVRVSETDHLQPEGRARGATWHAESEFIKN